MGQREKKGRRRRERPTAKEVIAAAKACFVSPVICLCRECPPCRLYEVLVRLGDW